jgi:hypothetical protein
MNLYLDASVMMPTLVAEQSSAGVDAFLLNNSDELIVSDFAAAEVAAALSRLIRTGRLAREAAMERLNDFDAWRLGETATVAFTASDFRLANLFVRRFDLKLHAPDALHAAICQRQEFQLVTLDRRLADAARELGIDAAVPTA